jgi:hypothetical protein
VPSLSRRSLADHTGSDGFFRSARDDAVVRSPICRSSMPTGRARLVIPRKKARMRCSGEPAEGAGRRPYFGAMRRGWRTSVHDGAHGAADHREGDGDPGGIEKWALRGYAIRYFKSPARARLTINRTTMSVWGSMLSKKALF